MVQLNTWVERTDCEMEGSVMADETIFQHVGGIEPAAGASFHPLTEQEIEEVEEACTKELPAPFREFLRDFGAFSCGEYVGFDPIEPLPSSISSDGKGPFSHFFGARSDDYDDTLGLLFNMRIYRDRMPTSLIPIGSDGGGNVVCLGIDGKHRCKIYYWDHNNEWDEDYLNIEKLSREGLKFQNVYLIANSFEEFAGRLFVIG